MNAEDIQRARDAHPVLQETLYLNTGTKGLTARPVVDALAAHTRTLELGGLPAYTDLQEQATIARRRLARLLGADDDELAFTANATHSLNIALCLRWDEMRPAPGRPVDVLISDHEYPTCNMVFQFLEQTGRARLIRYALSAGADEVLASLDAHATDAVRVVVASHVDCNTGLRAPVRAICGWCRARNIISYIDGAQAAGQFPVDLHEIGCDLYISNAHKWLFGPNGVGLLYVRRGFLDALDPPIVGLGTIVFGQPVQWVDGATRFELAATRPIQVLAALPAALDWLDSFGMGAIEARQRELSGHVKNRIQEQDARYRLLTPHDWDASSAMATLQVRGKTGDDITAFCARMFAEQRAVLRPVPEFDGLRLSMAYYNVEDEYERFFQLLETEL